MRPQHLRGAARAVVSVAFLLVVALFVDVGDVARRLSSLELRWVLLAVAVSVVQVLVSAWRWRYTARRLGVELPLRAAVAEYYLGTFLNQVLPGGVAGDVSRAWRHARAEAGTSPSSTAPSSAPDSTPILEPDARSRVHAVILERVSGQLVMTAVALASGLALLLASGRGGRGPAAAVMTVLVACVAAVLIRVTPGLLRRRFAYPVDRFITDARASLLGRALPVQAAVSLGIVASYVAVFVLAARAVGLEAPSSLLALTAPPILLAMLVPVSVAGWGLRESAAAALWGLVGLSAADGVAVSVAYGLLVFVTSLPGAAVVALRPTSLSAPDRRGDPSPG